MSEPAELRAVVFDLDGLIVNSEDLYELAGDEVLGRRGKTHDAALREQMTGRTAVDSLRLMIDYHALPDSLEDLLGESQEVLQRLMATSLDVMPGVRELVDALQAAEVPIAVATSGTRDYAADVLTRVRLADRFRFVLTAGDVERGKPSPDIYLLAAARLQLPPRQIMVLEDSANGCRAALAAGAFTVAVPNRHTRGHDFTGVALTADTLADAQIRAALGLAS